MVSGLRAFEISTGISLHFRSKTYDAVKYNFKTRASFHKRNDKYFFERLARRYPNEERLIEFVVLNHLDDGSSIWVGNMNEDRIEHHRAILETFGYHLKQNLTRYETFNGLIQNIYQDSTLDIHIKTVLDSLVDYTDQKISDDPLGIKEKQRQTITKYKPFIKQWIRLDKVREVIFQKFHT